MRIFSVTFFLSISGLLVSCGVATQENKVDHEFSAQKSTQPPEAPKVIPDGGARNSKFIVKWTSPKTNLEWKIFESEVEFSVSELDQACKDQGMQVPEAAYTPIAEDLKDFANAILTRDDGTPVKIPENKHLGFAVRHGVYDFAYEIEFTTFLAESLGWKRNFIKNRCSHEKDPYKLSTCKREFDEWGIKVSEIESLISKTKELETSSFVVFMPFKAPGEQWRGYAENNRRSNFLCHTIDPSRPAFMDRPEVVWPNVADYL